MMRMLSMSAFAAAALFGASFAITSATAQTPPAAAPAAPTQQMTSDGKPCGAVAYSVAEQKYVGIPCNAPAQQTSDGKPCGAVAYSVAEQKYVGVPCPTK